MPRLLSHDPITGVSQYFDYHASTDEIQITHTQDVSKLLDHIKEVRSQAKSKGTVEQFAHYAVIPAIVEMELAQKGIKLNDKNCTKALIREIETNYPWLKATEKVHA